jgi:hypothetical protein
MLETAQDVLGDMLAPLSMFFSVLATYVGAGAVQQQQRASNSMYVQPEPLGPCGGACGAPVCSRSWHCRRIKTPAKPVLSGCATCLLARWPSPFPGAKLDAGNAFPTLFPKNVSASPATLFQALTSQKTSTHILWF